MFTLLNSAPHPTLAASLRYTPKLLNCALHPTLAAPLRYTPKLCFAPYTSSSAANKLYVLFLFPP